MGSVTHLQSEIMWTNGVFVIVSGVLARIKVGDIQTVEEFIHQINKFSCLLCCWTTCHSHRSSYCAA